MTNQEYQKTQARYKELTQRQYELEVQIRINYNDPITVASLRTEYRQVTGELTQILLTNIEISQHGTN